MVGIHVTSEIKPLKKVLLHRPGKELLNLTPDTLERLLFDDIPFLKVAQAEHDRFAEILRENGVEVVYLEDLMAEVLDADPAVRKKFLEQFISEAGIRTKHWQKIVYDHLDKIKDSKELVLKTMEGVNLNVVRRGRRELSGRPCQPAQQADHRPDAQPLFHAVTRSPPSATASA